MANKTLDKDNQVCYNHNCNVINKRKEYNMKTHNISTLVGEIYDKLANNTQHEMFNVSECEDIMVDETKGIITITYQDKTFEVVVRERS